MIYLKRINESQLTRLDEVKEFCKDSLAYLLDDDGYNLSFEQPIFDIRINITHNTYIKWNEVKDIIVPFIKRVNNKFGLKKFPNYENKDKKVNLVSYGNNYYTLDELDTDIDFQITRIVIVC